MSALQLLRRLVLPVVLVALALPAAASAGASPIRYVIGFHNMEEGRSAMKQHGARATLELPRHAAAAALLSSDAYDGLRQDSRVIWIERDVKRHLMAQTTPYGIDMVQASQVTSPNPDAVKVCVIDSGYALGHEDLPQRVTGDNGDPAGGAGNWAEDAFGHGTHVAGTIAAMNNDLGVVGALPGARLHIVKVYNEFGQSAYSSDLVHAVDRCVAAGSRVVNMSLGGPESSRVEKRAFSKVYGDGVLLVASAGNEGTTQLQYPAAYDSVISVAAVDSAKQVASFSVHNKDVELAAPGVDVLSTFSYTETNRLSAGLDTWDGNWIQGGARTSGSGVTAPLADGGRCLEENSLWVGQIVLCERGDISFLDKYSNARLSGAVGMAVYNDAAGNFSGNFQGWTVMIPAISLSQEDGIEALRLVGTPGTIVSNKAYPGNVYESFSGTSMAAPHVSGVAALVWSFNPAWTNVQIRTALQKGAADLGAKGRDPYYGYGLVQAVATYCYLNSGCGA
jgi:subtilisin family serine protease